MIKILLVEDDLGLSNSVFDFLDDFADVMQVFDGEEGLYEAESGVYDLILLDLMLPEKNGFQVLKELREKGITTPVLIMTAKESLDDKGHGFNKEEFLMIKILLVEDDLGLSNSVFDFLDDFADVMQVFDGEEGLYEAESGVYDLILLDLMLPEKNGFQVLKELREKGITTPVLIMTAKESLDDKGHGFELGADDYLTKPFYLEELKMRIQALLKRSGKFNENTLTYGNIVVNLSTNTVKVEDTPVELLGKEFDLLVYFLQNQNVILPKTQIFDRLWGFDSDTTISVVEVYVSKIRKKLKGTTFAENLQTLRSVGYILKDVQ